MRLAWTRVHVVALRLSGLRLAPVAVSVAVLATGCHFPGTGGSGTVSGNGARSRWPRSPASTTPRSAWPSRRGCSSSTA